jgi:hypothetical protein
VQARSSPDKEWESATIGMQLSEGAELRTGPKSSVRFDIGPDQTFTIDRFTAIQILKANFESGKVFTDVGMKYGRTRYDVESAEREHDTKVRSPSSVLAVRGTKVSIYDQPPFAPRAVSLTGRAQFRDLKKQVNFGGVGKTQVSEKKDTPAAFAKDQTTNDPRGSFAGRTTDDEVLQTSLSTYGGTDFSEIGIFAFLGAARSGQFAAGIGTLPIEHQITFQAFWFGAPFADVDLSVVSPLGELVSLTSPTSASGGRFIGDQNLKPDGQNGIADANGGGSELIAWELRYPPGTYQVRAELKNPAQLDGASTSVTVVATDDPLVTGFQSVPIAGVSLSQAATVATGSVTAPIPPPRPGPQNVQAVQASKSGKQTRQTVAGPVKPTAGTPKLPSPSRTRR